MRTHRPGEEAISEGRGRYRVLDGWRGISILAVLFGHLLPLGPKDWKLNSATAALGMVLFFTLSGFLITTFLLERSNIKAFLIRRFCRIVPLAWLYVLLIVVFFDMSYEQLAANVLFFANLPPFWLTEQTGHLWSLCVEMQFYIAIALLVALTGARGLRVLPILALFVTGARALNHVETSIVTWYRIDEILAGATLAVLVQRQLPTLRRVLRWANPYLLVILLLAACHEDGGVLNYLRPYLSALLVGTTLTRQWGRLSEILEGRVLGYIAAISFALYVLHGLLVASWFGTGDRIVKYIKRPLLFLALFGLAHLSTFQFEKRFIDLGRRLSRPSREPQRALGTKLTDL